MHKIYNGINAVPSPVPKSTTGFVHPSHLLTFKVTSDNWSTTAFKVQISEDGENNWEDVPDATFDSTDNKPKNVLVGKGVWFRLLPTAVDSDANADAAVSM